MNPAYDAINSPAKHRDSRRFEAGRTCDARTESRGVDVGTIVNQGRKRWTVFERAFHLMCQRI
jgi:hypothetical protein